MPIADKVRIYIPFTIATFKQQFLAYRSRLIIWMIANFITVLFQVYLWISIYSNYEGTSINGYTLVNMINYIIVSKVIESLTFINIEPIISRDVNEGRIATSLIKPISYKTELLFRSLGNILGSLLLFIPIYAAMFIIFNWHSLSEIKLNLGIVLLSLTFIIISFVVNYLIALIFSSVIFKTIRHRGIYEIKKTIILLMSGALFPIEFYPSFLSKILKYTPFIYLRYIPVSFIINYSLSMKEIIEYVLFGAFWMAFLFFIASIVWNKMFKRIIVYGG
ncbi:MAG: ABC-2 family transporter protein [Firmicutes bacterium]|nr:ABC-2 family transporter protein [Bacillota bacterium]